MKLNHDFIQLRVFLLLLISTAMLMAYMRNDAHGASNSSQAGKPINER
jgi:hypothetical protein